ncbi:MAG: DNA-3-methyladenine glycosylase 2 family protein [Thaumarchaeota archaeon]|nr:DNA-3-methyladenine glycosylase 2 family protein [Nitrososphaerota archaeon]
MRIVSGFLDATPPFDFAQSYRFLEKFRPMAGEQRLSEKRIVKALMVGGETIGFRLSGAGSTDTSGIGYELLSNKPLRDAEKQYVADRISFFLSLKDDLNPFYAVAKNDKVFYPIVERMRGLHHVKFLTFVEIACWSIMAQHAPIAVARRMKDSFVEKLGDIIVIDGMPVRAFPDQTRLSGVTLELLYAIIKNKRRSEYLSWLISALKDVDEDFLRTADYDEAQAWLKQIKGIGDWSSTFILFRGLGRMERLGSKSQPIIKRMAQVYGPEMTLDEAMKIYGEWTGYWSLYLRSSE